MSPYNDERILAVCHCLIDGGGSMDRLHLSAFVHEMLEWLSKGQLHPMYYEFPQGDRTSKRALLTLLHDAELHVLRELHAAERHVVFEDDNQTTDEEVMSALEHLLDE